MIRKCRARQGREDPAGGGGGIGSSTRDEHLGHVCPHGIRAVHCWLQPPSLTKVLKSLTSLMLLTWPGWLAHTTGRACPMASPASNISSTCQDPRESSEYQASLANTLLASCLMAVCSKNNIACAQTPLFLFCHTMLPQTPEKGQICSYCH